AWTRPGARSARRGHCSPHCIAGRFVIGDRTMFKTPTIRGYTIFRAHKRSFHRNQARPRLELLEDRIAPATFTVSNTLDDGSTGSLRWAITQVNNDSSDSAAQPDIIAFNIAASVVQTIQVGSSSAYLGLPLPNITNPVIMDATTLTTLPGYAGSPIIVLDGTNAGGGANGLDFT